MEHFSEATCLATFGAAGVRMLWDVKHGDVLPASLAAALSINSFKSAIESLSGPVTRNSSWALGPHCFSHRQVPKQPENRNNQNKKDEPSRPKIRARFLQIRVAHDTKNHCTIGAGQA